jgi:phosphohistidine phosphatase SixA
MAGADMTTSPEDAMQWRARSETEAGRVRQAGEPLDRLRVAAAFTICALIVVLVFATCLLIESWPSLFPAQQSMVVLMRHGDAPGRTESDNFDLTDCTTQRNLSDKGRSEAAETGEAIRRQALNIKSVVSSRWCRTRETAKLLGFSDLHDEVAFDNLEFNKAHADEMLQAERRIIQNWQGPGILLIVTHSSNIKALTGLELGPSSMIIAEKRNGAIQFRASPIVLKDLFS